jgi:peptide/nickel transport system permease protein
MTGSARAIGLAIFFALAGFAVFGPWLIDIDPNRQNLRMPLAPFGSEYLLGTDHFGRSLLARLAHGARISLGFAFLTVLSAAIPGTILGLVAAIRPGLVDRVLSSFADAILAIPGLLLVVLFVAFAPGKFGPLYLGLSLSLWVEYFRLTRATTRAVLARPHVEAARLLGFGPAYIARHHVLPEIVPLLLTLMAFGMGAAILAISTLSYMSIGLRPPIPEWGSMIVELLPHFFEAPVHVLLPAAFIFLAVLSPLLMAQRTLR